MLQIWQFMISLDALLSLYAEKFRWWKLAEIICNENDLPIYLREAYLFAKSEKLKWYMNIMDIFKSFGLDQLNEYFTINKEIKHLINYTFI